MATDFKLSQSRCNSVSDDVAMETAENDGSACAVVGDDSAVDGAGVVADSAAVPLGGAGVVIDGAAVPLGGAGVVIDGAAAPLGGAGGGGRGAQPVRSSTRILKRPKRDFSPPSSPPKKSLPKEQKEKRSRTPKVGRATKRHEVWSMEDKDVFFEALAEHGKNFEAIKSHVERKHLSSKADPSLVKTKDQVRHLYYRTWAKISKYIEQKEGISKHAIELYSLINYAELRKKIGPSLDEKTGAKLNELVHKGTAGLRFNKRYYRLKTPTCPALKNLNKAKLGEQEAESKEDAVEPTRIPEKLAVDLRPHTNQAWAQVQNISQNPRVRIHVRPEQRMN